MIFHFETTGAVRLQAVFADLGAALRDKMLKKAVKDTLTPIETAAKAFIAVDRTGALRGSISVKVTSKNTAGSIVYGVVGPRRNVRIPIRIVAYGKNKGKLAMAIPTRYAHLVEFGHNIVVKGRVVGHAAPRPFMRKAWVSDGGDIAFFRFESSMTNQLRDWLASVIP